MLKKNILANYIGQGWVSFMGLLFIPFYLKILGSESYGLIGLFAVLQVCLGILNVGMSPTLGREMARFNGGALSKIELKNLLRSIEVLALSIALLNIIIVYFIAEWLSKSWLNLGELSVDTARYAISIMGVVLGVKLFESIYRSALIGLQKQVAFNFTNALLSTIRGGGAILVLSIYSPSIENFFIWQVLVSLASVLTFKILTDKFIGKTSDRSRFSLDALRKIKKFAGGMFGISIVTVLITQIDKIILTKYLSMHDFGNYTLVATLAGILFVLVGPINQAIYPRLCTLVASGKKDQQIEYFHKGSQLVTLVVGSAGIFGMFFAEEILYLWTANNDLAKNSSTILVFLLLGNLLNTFVHMPGRLQIANGVTKVGFVINIISLFFVIPLLLYSVPKYGVNGAIFTWVLLNSIYLLIGVHFNFRKILEEEKNAWYFRDLLLPVLVGTLICYLFYIVKPSNYRYLENILYLGLSYLIVFVSILLASNKLNIYVLKYFRN